MAAVAGVSACSHDRPPAPAPAHSGQPERAPRVAVVEAPKELALERSPHKATLGRHSELYVPPWFTAKNGGYDLMIHFHGEGRWQEANVEHARLNVAVVSVNLGVGTEHYAKPFKSADAFEHLLTDAHAELVKSGRVPEGAKLRRLALSAWSAGFSSIAKVMTDDVAQRVDAILLADGFFTYFTEPKKRTVNPQGIEKFARFADRARKDEKLFAITHTTIPTGPNPSVQECVTKLLAMIEEPKTPAPAKVVLGPRTLQQLYVVDKGSLHIRGYEGTTAPDHVRQLHAMGETVYPYLKARWDKQDAAPAAVKPHAPTAPTAPAAPAAAAVTPAAAPR